MTSAGTHSEAELNAALAPSLDHGAAAFFDVDNTMMRGASIYYLARGLAARQYFTSRDLLRFGARQMRFRVIANEHRGHISSTREAALAFVEGRPVEQLRQLCEEIFDEVMAERVWSGTLAMARLHLDAGQPVWLVTAAPVELGDVIARRLGLTGAIGTVSEIVDGIYTGRLVGEMMHGPAKATAITELGQRLGLDLSRCSAYSDSINDLPMLSTVGRPVAVNPDTALRRLARQRGWEIRDFRTGRRVVRLAVPVMLGVGAAAGATAAALGMNRRQGRPAPPS